MLSSLRNLSHQFWKDLARSIKCSVGMAAKICLIFWGASYLPMLALHVLWRRVSHKNIVNPHALLLRDIVVTNEDGVFHCRRRTGDFITVCPHTEESLRPYWIASQGVCVDVGANVGKYTVALGTRLHGAGRIVAVEADPSNFQALLRNIEANSLDNVIPVNAACCSEDGPVTLHLHQYAAGLHTIRNGACLTETFPRAITVSGRRLDSILQEANVSDVTFLKVDTEGSELQVLEGGLDLLRRSKTLTILIEAWTPQPLQLLKREGFDVTYISGKDFIAVKRPSRARAQRYDE